MGADALGRLVANGPRLASVLYAMVESQADERFIDDEDFMCALAGERATFDASTALVEALAECSPDTRVRIGLRALVEDHAGDRRGLDRMATIS